MRTLRALGPLLACALLAACRPAAAESAAQASPDPPTDWPALISRLRQQEQSMPGQAAMRLQLATAYNNYGVELVGQRKYRDAEAQLEEARRLQPANDRFLDNLVVLHLNAAQDAYQARDAAEAKRRLERAIVLDPDRATAHALLGEIEYQAQRLKEAKQAWTRAIALDPTLKDIQRKLEQVTQELPVESQFDRISQFSFDVRYADEVESRAGYDIRDMLLRARREVGGDFTLWPKYKLVVLVYTAEQFKQLRAQTPDWVAGQFDGKIRMPMPSQALPAEEVTRILFHEYAHALVHDAAGGHCPTWLNEGLATYEAWKDGQAPWTALKAAAAEDRLIPWDQLSSWFRYERSMQDVQLAYEQSHSIVLYLARRYGFWRIRRILADLGQGRSLEEAFATHLPVKPERLPKEWRSWLKDQLPRA
jgi:tetratricopeptide (TPR) repeat protein